MKDNFIKYKHHMLLILALFLIKFCVVPLFDNQESLRLSVKQINKKLDKVTGLIAQKDKLDEFSIKQTIETSKAEEVLFSQPDEAGFKLAAQTELNNLLTKLGCEVEQLGWKGADVKSEHVKMWQLDARYKGNAKCLLMATRQIEQLTPVIRIKSYAYGGKVIESSPSSSVTVNVELVMWQYISRVDKS